MLFTKLTLHHTSYLGVIVAKMLKKKNVFGRCDILGTPGERHLGIQLSSVLVHVCVYIYHVRYLKRQGCI